MNSNLILHLLNRKNKRKPFNDGRKIVLLHSGGIMAGVQGCGALAALQEIGLTGVFDEVYTISAGLPNVAYFLAEQSETSIDVYCKDLSGKKFINLFRFWRIEDVNYLMDVFQKSKRKLLYERIDQQGTRIYVIMKNRRSGEIGLVRVPISDSKIFFLILKSAVSVPFLSSNPTQTGEFPYQDVFMSFEKQRQLLIEKVIASKPTDVLAIYNRSIRRPTKLASTNLNMLEIAPGNWLRKKRFETDSKILRTAAENMRELTKSFFSTRK